MGIDDDRKISRFVPERLPEFVRVDHPTLVAFLEAYYEWLELRRNSGVVLSPMVLHDITDVDTSLDQFIDNFKQQYMLNFPESLAISPDTGKPVDERRLLKNIKQFYLAKGTEKSYEFLFRVFYDTNVEFYYPKNDILRLSSGRWVQNNFLRISNTIGDSVYRAAGNLIVQRNSSGQIIATARVINVNVYQIDNFDVAELLISGRNGTFQTGDVGIEFADGDDTFDEVKVYSVVSTISIVSGGANYQIGDRVNFVSTSNDGGQRARGTVAEIDAAGGIRKINIDDFGINYSNPPAIQIESVRGTGFVGNVAVGSLCQAFGYYANNDGRLSTNKVLQDNHYYQNWSYVLKSEVVIDSYRELVRRLVHPSGTAMFGSVLVKRCSTVDLRNATSMMSFHVPYIGNYAAYTPRTFDDLSVWFQKEQSGALTAAGYDPNTHDVLIAGVGEGLVQPGNPLSNNILFVENDANALVKSEPGSPLWIVYPHANTEVDRGYHYARVWKNQARDVIRWREWFFNREDNYSDARYEWMKSIDSSLDLSDALDQYPRYSGESLDGVVGEGENECCIPGMSCNEGCDNTEANPCIAYCDCIGGDWNDGICTCPDGLVGMWNGSQFVCLPGEQGNPESPLDESCPNCICGFRNYSLTAHAGTILSYDENSEFGKITLRAFLNMPEGQAFDCREEEIVAVSLPEIIIRTPTSGQVIQTSDSDLPLHIEYSISNAENLGYYRAVQVNVYIDNHIRATLSVNTSQVTLIGVANGRRTLKMELVDSDGKLVAGTQKVLLFGYQYVQPT